MFNAATKSLMAALALTALVACSDSEKEGATKLFNEAQTQIDSNNYGGALVVLDTLNSRYPAQTAIRKDALRLRALAMQGLATDSIAAGSEALAQATLNLEQVEPNFRHVDSSVGLEGYYLPKGVSDQMMMESGLQARVSDKGFFYIVVNVQGKSIGLQSIEFVDGSESISSSDISSSRVIKVEGSESASFNPEDLEGIGAWLTSHPGANKVVLHGTKSNVNVKLTDKLRNEITDCYTFSEALQAKRLASLKREKYERMLATARDQLANLPVNN